MVRVEPIFDEPAIHDPRGQNAANGELFTSWWNAHQFSLMRSMGGKVDRHPVPFCDHIVNGKVNVGTSLEIVAGVLLDAVAVLRIWRRECVVNVVGIVEIVAAAHVVRVNYLVEQPPDNRFVLVRDSP